MPSVSGRQHRFMEMVAHNPGFAHRVGVPQSVGQDFSQADKGRSFKDSHKMPRHHTNALLDHHKIKRSKRHGHRHHHVSRHGHDDAHTSSAQHLRPYYDAEGGGGHPFYSHSSSERPDRYGYPNAHPTDHPNNPHYAVHGHEPHSRDDHYHVGKGRFDRLTAPEHSPSVVDVQHSHMPMHDQPVTSAGRPDRYAQDRSHHDLFRHETVAREGHAPPNQRKNMHEGHDDGYQNGIDGTYNQHIYGHDNQSRHTGRQDRYGRDLDAHQLYRHERVHREHNDVNYPNLAKSMRVGRDDGYDATDGGPHSTYNQGIYDRNNRTTRGVRY